MKNKIIIGLVLGLVLLNNCAKAQTYATWDSANKSAGITLSGGDLVATNNSGSAAGVRSTVGVSSGKWYWEITATTIGAFARVGISNSSYTFGLLGNTANSWGYNKGNGNKFNNGDLGAYGASFATGDVIGVALDLDGGTLTYYKNNTTQGTAFTGLSGTFYAAISVSNTNDVYTANFGATTLTYTPPSGFNAGLYTGAGSSDSGSRALRGVGK